MGGGWGQTACHRQSLWCARAPSASSMLKWGGEAQMPLSVLTYDFFKDFKIKYTLHIFWMEYINLTFKWMKPFKTYQTCSQFKEALWESVWLRQQIFWWSLYLLLSNFFFFVASNLLVTAKGQMTQTHRICRNFSKVHIYELNINLKNILYVSILVTEKSLKNWSLLSYLRTEKQRQPSWWSGLGASLGLRSPLGIKSYCPEAGDVDRGGWRLSRVYTDALASPGRYIFNISPCKS